MSSGNSDTGKTFFAPAGRAGADEVRDAHEAFLTNSIAPVIIEGIPDPVLVVNAQRQIVACNRVFLTIAGADGPEIFLGQRPGEAIECEHCHDGPDGCGTGEHCLDCGAVNALMDCLSSRSPVSRECRLQTHKAGALDLLVRANLVTAAGRDFVVIALRDISAEKRRAVLERVFFHDVLNTASSIRALAWMMEDERQAPQQRVDYRRDLILLSDQIADEIIGQRQLLAAERGELQPAFTEVYTDELIPQIVASYRNHDVARDRTLVVGPVPHVSLHTDPTLLRRVLGNLVKNALEATEEHGTVSLAVERERRQVRFSVTNPGVMPEEVQRQIFQRSFTTKAGEGRGVGCYSVRLLVEGYLGGTVSFLSKAAAGTVFTVTLPLHAT